jgi:hypothetical protein
MAAPEPRYRSDHMRALSSWSLPPALLPAGNGTDLLRVMVIGLIVCVIPPADGRGDDREATGTAPHTLTAPHPHACACLGQQPARTCVRTRSSSSLSVALVGSGQRRPYTPRAPPPIAAPLRSIRSRARVRVRHSPRSVRNGRHSYAAFRLLLSRSLPRPRCTAKPRRMSVCGPVRCPQSRSSASNKRGMRACARARAAGRRVCVRVREGQ